MSRSFRSRLPVTAVAAAIVAFCMACGESVTVSTSPIASMDVSPEAAEIQVDDGLAFTATPRDSEGRELSGWDVVWISSNEAVAAVNHEGLVTGRAPGSATITARSQGHEGFAEVVVSPIPVASIDVSPGSAGIHVGEQTTFTATARDAEDDPLPDRSVSWSSSDESVASVDHDGRVTGEGTGTATITAASGGKKGTATVNVSPVPVASVEVSPSSAEIEVGEETELTATPLDADDEPLSGRDVTWSTSDASVATVDDGMVTGTGPGTATITATSEGEEGTGTVTVSPVPVAAVEVSPSSAEIEVGEEMELTATPLDADNQPLSGRDVTWSTSDASIATVSDGVVTGTGPGTATITATSEGEEGTAAVTVSPVPVAAVEVSPGSAEIQVGETVGLTATPVDADGQPLPDREITWTTSDPFIATVDDNGVVTGTGPGTATITAASEGESGVAGVEVVSPPDRTSSPGDFL